MRLITFTTLIAGLLAVAFAPAARAEGPTPQAINAHAEFLAYSPPPPAATKVCVVDTGIDLTTDVAPAVIERYSEFGGSVDDSGGGGIDKHGTFVAGVIASARDGQASVGVWPAAQIISDRVFPSRDSGTTVAKYLQALDRCRARGAQVINLSLAGLPTATGTELAELENKITNMRNFQGVNVVAAVGNSGSEIGYPARFPQTLAVGASDATGTLCPFSSRGPELDISALGCGTEVSLPGAVLGVANGTSYSAPVVSAVLAALRAYRPGLSAAAAENLLMDSAHAASAGRIIDASAAFRAAGLDALVALAPPPGAESPAAPAPGSGTVVTESVALRPTSDELASLGIRVPRVRSASYGRGVLSVSVQRLPDFARAIFRVDSHRYARSSGVLRVRLKRRPRRVDVAIDVPGVGRTAPVHVLLKRKTALRRKNQHAG